MFLKLFLITKNKNKLFGKHSKSDLYQYKAKLMSTDLTLSFYKHFGTKSQCCDKNVKQYPLMNQTNNKEVFRKGKKWFVTSSCLKIIYKHIPMTEDLLEGNYHKT